MRPRTRAPTPSSIASNQSSKSRPSAATAAPVVVSLVWRGLHSSASTPESLALGDPETTQTQFQPPPRRDQSECRRPTVPHRSALGRGHRAQSSRFHWSTGEPLSDGMPDRSPRSTPRRSLPQPYSRRVSAREYAPRYAARPVRRPHLRRRGRRRYTASEAHSRRATP
jgi:hypothetical protein